MFNLIIFLGGFLVIGLAVVFFAYVPHKKSKEQPDPYTQEWLEYLDDYEPKEEYIRDSRGEY